MAAGNKQLTSGQVLPGFWGYVDYNTSAPAQAPNLKCLLWGYVGGSALATPNQPFKPVSKSDCDNQTGGASTDLSRWFAAANSQPDAQGAEIWCMPITPPSGGVASTYQLTVFVGSTNPAKAGTIQLWVASQQIAAVGFTTSDTATTIGAAVAAALLAQTSIPIASAVNASGVVTVTYAHKGTTGEDLPVRCNIAPNASGVNLSPGQALYATAAVGVGSAVVTVGGVTVSTALAGGETPAQVATKVVASFNAGSYPVTAVVDGTVPAQVDFYFNANGPIGWDVRRMTASIVTSTGTTVNLGSGATSGAGLSTSTTLNGTQGAGLPSLGSAITNLTNQTPWYRSWMTPWADTTSLGTMATYIESAENGSITGQKLQILTACDWQSLTVDSAIPAAVSPNLTTSAPHYALGWAPDCSVQAPELAARVAAARAALWISAPQKNWNGYRLVGNVAAPLLLPPTTPDKNTQNSALRNGLSPWIPGPSGNVEIVKGRTTSLASDMRLWAWSAEAQAAYHWQDLQSYFAQLFQGGSLVKFGPPKAAGLFDDQSFVDATIARMHLWESQGNYDGADALAAGVNAARNQANPNREDVNYPESPVLDLDQVAFTGFFMSQSS